MSSYDHSLLATAPELTKPQIQEGYTTDLLEKPYNVQLAEHPVVTPRPGTGNTSPNRTVTEPEVAALVSKDLTGKSAPVPCWRTRKGIKILVSVFAVFAIVAIVVGVAVGVSVSKNKGKNANKLSSGADPSGSEISGNNSNGVNPTNTGTSPHTTGNLDPPPVSGAGGDGAGRGGTQETGVGAQQNAQPTSRRRLAIRRPS